MSKLTALACLLLALIFSLLLSITATSSAQSGRRSKKPDSPPVVAPTPDAPAPTPTPAPKDLLPILVGMDDRGGLHNFPPYFYSTTEESFVMRLRENKSLDVNDFGSMTRAEAIKKAKAERTGYIVYLELRLESFDPGVKSQDARSAVIEYDIFAPTTARNVKSGHTYAEAYQKKAILLPRASGIYNEYLLTEAAKAAADEVLEYLKNHKTGPLN